MKINSQEKIVKELLKILSELNLEEKKVFMNLILIKKRALCTKICELTYVPL